MYNQQKKIRMFVLIMLIFLIITKFLFSQEIPQVVNNTIVFLDGETTIQINRYDSYHIFNEKNLVVFITVEIIPNLGVYTIKFFDFYGRTIADPIVRGGELQFIFLEDIERIFAGQKAVLTSGGPSFLYDLNGNLINTLTHNNPSSARQVGVTEDHKYFWLSFERTRLLNPGETPRRPGSVRYEWNQIMIYDTLTGNLVKEYSTQNYPFNFELNGINYTIPINPPR